MNYNKTINANLALSAIGTECWSFGGGEYWGDQNQKDLNDVVRASVDFGINYFDTAEAHNESALMTGNGDDKPLKSLGVHEHWNNPVDKKYHVIWEQLMELSWQQFKSIYSFNNRCNKIT